MDSPAGLQTPFPVQLAHTIDEKEVMNGDLERQAARQAGENDVLAVWESGPKNPRNWSIPLLQETYAPVLKYRLSVQESSGLDADEQRKIHPTFVYGSLWRFLWVNLKRPLIILSTSLICFALSLYLAYMYGIYYIMFTTFPDLFGEVYGFSIGISGLTYIGIGLGFTAATIVGARGGNWVYQTVWDLFSNMHLSTNRPSSLREMAARERRRCAFRSFFVPIGIFWYGWSAQAKIHWIMPIIGTTIFGFGLMLNSIPIQLYLVDSFTYAASSIAAASTFRSLLGFAFPLFGQQLYAKLGIGGGNSLLAGLSIIIGIPFPILLWFHGAKMRSMSALTRHDESR
ncbi:hypothetical protein D9757_012234 [Collybiopsis confluens]|uniref:Uncharacterized protein n=1 Tax=Collybiopsis confluens TaxID=2823264 RepID=A0A8H5LK02_9AGAR|nr:hypothetical protein D9757_012234 [Collybiopsis confluens]